MNCVDIKETYQDIWVKGKCIRRGIRECERRYGIIRRFCRNYHRPFTVLDIGANLGYFSLRLAEDFDCTVVAVEGRPDIGMILEENKNNKVIWLPKMLGTDALLLLAEVEHFDVVLALSVINHLHDTGQRSLEALMLLGDNLIFEHPIEKSACNPERAVIDLPIERNLIGVGESHIEPHAFRPIYKITNKKDGLAKRYIGDIRPRPCSVIIKSTYSDKLISYADRPEKERDWYRGINLITYLHFDGEYPPRNIVADMLRQEFLSFETHGDISPWNVILQGDGVKFIDCHDPTFRDGYSDKGAMKKMIDMLGDV